MSGLTFGGEGKEGARRGFYNVGGMSEQSA